MKQNYNNLQVFHAVQFHPLFHGVEFDKALALLDECHIRHYEKNEIILTKDKQGKGLILQLEGISEVFVRNDTYEVEEVLEVIQKGEMIGFSSLSEFLGVAKPIKTEVMLKVKAVTEVKALFIPYEVITKRWDDPTVHDYFLTQIAIRLKDVYMSLAEQVNLARDHGEKEAFMVSVQDIMREEVVAVSPEISVQKTAQIMHEKQTSSVLVIDNDVLQGIITERDMVERVIARGISLSTPARDIMTLNPISISRFSYYYDAISLIFLKGIKHLPVIEESKVVGIVNLSDLLRKKNKSIIKTIQKIEQADQITLPQVKRAIYDIIDTFLKDKVPILTILDIVTNLYDRLVKRAVELSIQTLQSHGKNPPSDFAFYQMGSSGRREQFILTDQDHFLVYDECDAEAEQYFEELGKEISSQMEVAGYVRCKGLMMCSEVQWRGSLSMWENRLRKWMIQSTPENLLLAQNFFSYRYIIGSENLHERFELTILEQLQRSKIFLFKLAQIEREHTITTLDQPLRSLFKLERKNIDMKKEVLFPYHHSLQILSLLHGIVSGTPIEKINFLKEKGVLSQELANDLKEAVSKILSIYVTQRWQQKKANKELTSIVHFTRMSTREKEELILSLKTLKELQNQVFSFFPI